MPCEHYKDALIEVAASGAAPQGELSAHLAKCASCRAAFAEEQSLFATIDSSLHVMANAEVPPSLLPRVRVALNEAAAPRLRWLHPIVFASAGVALALAVFLMARPRHAPPENVAMQVPVIVPAPVTQGENTNSQKIPGEGTQVAAIRVSHRHSARNSANIHSSASSNPEVLVPPGAEAALLRSLPWLLKKRTPSVQLQEGQEGQLEIAPLAIEALSPDERDSDRKGGGQSKLLAKPAKLNSLAS